MNRFYILENEKIANEQYLINCPLRSNHLINVLHKKINQELKLVLINKGLAIGVIKQLTPHIKITVTKHQKLSESQLQKYKKEITLIIGLSRPPTLKKIIEHGTSLGVTSFVFLATDLGQKSYQSSHVLSSKHIEETLCLGLAQSSYYYKLPNIKFVKNHKELIDNPNNYFNQNSFLFFLDLTGDAAIKIHESNNSNITLAIGSERGWTNHEREIFKSLDFKSIQLGNSILRTEIATFVTLGYCL